MPKLCSYGTCNNDSRYPERLVGGVFFIPFPNPKKQYEKCVRWISLCGRPPERLNVSKINRNRYVCSKHFKDGKGPTEEYPDPAPSLGPSRSPMRVRPPPKEGTNSPSCDVDSQSGSMRRIVIGKKSRIYFGKKSPVYCSKPMLGYIGLSKVHQHPVVDESSTSAQIEEKRISPTDTLMLSCEVTEETELEETRRQHQELKERLEIKDIKHIKYDVFNVDDVMADTVTFKCYTGFMPEAFNTIFTFLVPSDQQCPFNYPYQSKESSILTLKDQLFFVLCKLRHDFDFSDLSVRFGLSIQFSSSLFIAWINYMYLRFGQVEIWPYRAVLIEQMPEDFKSGFPNTFAVLNCAELIIEKPSSYTSDTLKGLVAVGPRGYILFSSKLFPGSTSDKDIFVNSGIQGQLEKLIKEGVLNQGDGIIADEGFNIKAEVENVGLKLNVPSFSQSERQMSQADALLTTKITKHREHVERAIRRIKEFKILTGRIKLNSISFTNQVWFTCSMLTNYMPPFIKCEDGSI